MRLGLFQQLFWRVFGLLLLTVASLIFFAHVYQQRVLDEARRSDLQNEADWVGVHFGAPTTPKVLADAWQWLHGAVRLTVLDVHGNSVADSDDQHPLTAADIASERRLMARAAIVLADGKGTLILSRARMPIFHGHIYEFLGWMLVILALAVLAFYPLVRRLTRTFVQLADLARRVAGGHFGATLSGPPQRELADLVTSFNDMSQRLQREEQRRQRLIVDVSHELRSPMARLRALGETIARRPEEAAPHLAQLETEIALMDRLVGDMLDNARLEQGAASLHLQPVAIRAWLEQTVAQLRPRIEQAGAEFRVALPEAQADVAIDAQRLIQVLGNLVENALKAVAGRTGARLELELAIAADRVDIALADNGRGIAEDDLPFVFDRFYRVDRDRGRASGGAGLGLSIARAIVEAHGGRLSIASTVDVGTRVLLSLPRA